MNQPASGLEIHRHPNTNPVYRDIAASWRRFNDQICRVISMPSTSRTTNQYFNALFPDCASEEAMHALLAKGDLLDAGSGTTHKNPYSLFNHIPESGVGPAKIVAIDRRIAQVAGDSDGFRLRDGVTTRMMITYKDLGRILSLRAPKREMNTSNIAQGANLRNLPHGDESFRQIVSMYCYPYWISEEDSVGTFQEFDRVLQPGGQMRFCPDYTLRGTSLLSMPDIAQTVRHHYGIDVHEPKGIGGMRDSLGHSTLILTKNES
ncbi:MAG: class I SAM-dependent methyltransferase [Candidatus Peribacteraceae bacterium]|jgi:hypothetical protein|nr:class I SAM-dependent methyltransferase [Candidatus Peribacteraceae bacterium]MDP7646195.1 class I SAM-dependent methyltransferase [Candidatus Peribacteraceae bacterium]